MQGPKEQVEIDETDYCLHEESECGVCSDCGEEVDWVRRRYGHED